MNAIDKTLAGQNAISAQEGVSLDDYVRSAWAAVGGDCKAEVKLKAEVKAEANAEADAYDRADARESGRLLLTAAALKEKPSQRSMRALPASPLLASPVLMPSVSMPPVSTSLVLTSPKSTPRIPSPVASSAEAEAATSQFTSLRTHARDEQFDDMPVTAYMPQPLLPQQPDLSWRPQQGAAAPANLSARVVANVLPARSQQDNKNEAANPRNKPLAKAVPATARQPLLAANQAVVINSNNQPNHQPAALRTDRQDVIKNDLQLPTSTSASASASTSAAGSASVADPLPLHKDKSSPQLSDQAWPPSQLPLTSGQPVALVTAEQPRQTRAKPQAQPAPAAAAITIDSAPNNGGSLTYRFDKWNGNHAVTVRTAAPADLPQNTAAATAAPGLPSPDAGPFMPAPASAPPSPASLYTAQPQVQYTLSPSDPLVGQRLGEHLAQFGHAADTPAFHLKDADEQPKRQQQAPQEDDEEDA